MEQLQTVSAVSKNLGISNRMLRYYEQIGLVQSQRVEGYAYRVYDDQAIRRLRQIIVLRKLRVSVKQICEILSNNAAANVIEVFERNIGELDEEITAMATIREILQNLVAELREKANMQLRLDWINDSSVLTLVDALAFPQNTIREDKTMEDLNKAGEKLDKLTDRDVRIVYLPPAMVAAAYAKGTEPGPELVTGDLVDQFIKDKDLKNIYPASRHFGFNNPDEPVHGEGHGYERYITIPDDMDVPAPLVKKHFIGGIYAAHTIPFGEWDAWLKLHEWVGNNNRYDFNWGTIQGVCGWIEEHLNYWNWYTCGLSMGDVDESRQIDLMIPIELKG